MFLKLFLQTYKKKCTAYVFSVVFSGVTTIKWIYMPLFV